MSITRIRRRRRAWGIAAGVAVAAAIITGSGWFAVAGVAFAVVAVLTA